MDLTSEETIEFAKLNSSVVVPSQGSLNPYYLGLKIFEDIEKRWDAPSEEDQRRFDCEAGQGPREDVRGSGAGLRYLPFLRNYLTKKLNGGGGSVLHFFEKEKRVEESRRGKLWTNIREQLVYSRVNGGFPVLEVHNGDFNRTGELYLAHHFEGVELDLKYVERTLPRCREPIGQGGASRRRSSRIKKSFSAAMARRRVGNLFEFYSLRRSSMWREPLGAGWHRNIRGRLVFYIGTVIHDMHLEATRVKEPQVDQGSKPPVCNGHQRPYLAPDPLVPSVNGHTGSYSHREQPDGKQIELITSPMSVTARRDLKMTEIMHLE